MRNSLAGKFKVSSWCKQTLGLFEDMSQTLTGSSGCIWFGSFLRHLLCCWLHNPAQSVCETLPCVCRAVRSIQNPVHAIKKAYQIVMCNFTR